MVVGIDDGQVVVHFMHVRALLRRLATASQSGGHPGACHRDPSCRLLLALADSWIPGTSPGMTRAFTSCATAVERQGQYSMADADKIARGDSETRAMQAAAGLYHAYFTGLILTLVTRRSAADAAEWVFRVFRHQHHEKFLSSFDKLGLAGMPAGGRLRRLPLPLQQHRRRGGRVHARERPQGLGQFRAAALDLSGRQHLRGAERGVARLPARLVRAERGVAGQPAAGLRVHGADHRRAARAVWLFPGARPGDRPRGAPAIPPRRAGAAVRCGRGPAPAGCLDARAPCQGRAQLRHGIHPLRPAAAGRDLRAGRGRPSRARHRPAGRRPALQGDGGAARRRARRRAGLRRVHGAVSPPARAMRATVDQRRATPCWCIGAAGG